jgi:E3 ubiquitin-protein ligase SIAH1
MGDDDEVEKSNYILEVRGKGQKMTWQGVPYRITYNHKKFHESHDGLIIQRNMALFFSGSDKKELKLTISILHCVLTVIQFYYSMV